MNWTCSELFTMESESPFDEPPDFGSSAFYLSARRDSGPRCPNTCRQRSSSAMTAYRLNTSTSRSKHDIYQKLDSGTVPCHPGKLRLILRKCLNKPHLISFAERLCTTLPSSRNKRYSLLTSSIKSKQPPSCEF